MGDEETHHNHDGLPMAFRSLMPKLLATKQTFEHALIPFANAENDIHTQAPTT